MSQRRVIMILADGSRADTFQKVLDSEKLPNIKSLINQGALREASTVWPSATGPAHLPMLSGAFPGEANVPGLRWFERSELFPNMGLGIIRIRSYIGWESGLFDKDLSPDVKTLFGQVKSRAALQVFSSGLKQRDPIFKLAKTVTAHYSGKYQDVDQYSLLLGSKALKKYDPDFLFLMLPGIDGHSHHTSPNSKETIQSYYDLDEIVGKLKKEADDRETLWIICSDHGHSSVTKHLDIDQLLYEHGMRVACHTRRLFQYRPNAVVCVSGNSMAHLYLKGHNWGVRPTLNEIEECYPWLSPLLLEQEEIDILVTRKEDGAALIQSRRGQANLKEQAGVIHYQVIDSDPFGYAYIKKESNYQEALEQTFNSDYPDALVQIAQMLRSSRSGDMIISASPGCDLRDKDEFIKHMSGHGALHKEHMMVPFVSSEPLLTGPARTVDIYATACDYLGVQPGKLNRGRSLLDEQA